MKKSVILLLSVVCLLSVLLVSFIGRAVKHIDETVYVTDIDVKDYDHGVYETHEGTKIRVYHKTIYYDEEGYARYQINCLTKPVNATNNKIKYTHTNKATTPTAAVNEETGFVEVTNPAKTDVIVEVSISPAGIEVLNEPIVMRIQVLPQP